MEPSNKRSEVNNPLSVPTSQNEPGSHERGSFLQRVSFPQEIVVNSPKKS